MADDSPSGIGLPENQNGELNETASVSPNENDEELISLEDEEDEDEDEGEASEGNLWSRTEIDGLSCSMCMKAWTSSGDHHICCLPCGHIFGMSCIQRWLKRCQNQGQCPQCDCSFTLKDVRKLCASRVVAVDEEAQKRIQLLEKKYASLQNENEVKFLDCLQTIADSISATSNSQCKNGPGQRMLSQQILHSMNLGPDLYIAALDIFVKEPEWCELFIQMDEEWRMDWLKYELQPRLPLPSSPHPTS